MSVEDFIGLPASHTKVIFSRPHRPVRPGTAAPAVVSGEVFQAHQQFFRGREHGHRSDLLTARRR